MSETNITDKFFYIFLNDEGSVIANNDEIQANICKIRHGINEQTLSSKFNKI